MFLFNNDLSRLTHRKVILYESLIKKLCFEVLDNGKTRQRPFCFTEIDKIWLDEIQDLNVKEMYGRDPHIYAAIKELCKWMTKLEVNFSENYRMIKKIISTIFFCNTIFFCTFFCKKIFCGISYVKRRSYHFCVGVGSEGPFLPLKWVTNWSLDLRNTKIRAM